MKSISLCSISVMLLGSMAFPAPTGGQSSAIIDRANEVSQKESTSAGMVQRFSEKMGINRQSRSSVEKNDVNSQPTEKKSDSVINLALKDFSSMTKACGEDLSNDLVKQQMTNDYEEVWLGINDQTVAKRAISCLWAAKKWVETLDKPQTIRLKMDIYNSDAATKILSDKKLFKVTNKARFVLHLSVTKSYVQLENLFLAISKNENVLSFKLYRSDLDEGETVALSKILEKNAALQKLDLWNIKLDPKGTVKLMEALKINTGLMLLDMADTRIGEKEVAALSDALKINSRLQELLMAGVGIGNQGAKLLVDGLMHNSALQHLNLEQNGIGHDGAEYLSSALQYSAIKTLNMKYNSIGGQGVAAIISKAKLKKLLVSDNGMDDQGAQQIAEAVKDASDLQFLELTGCKIKDDGAAALATALSYNATLVELDLRFNEIKNGGAKALAGMLKRNNALKELKLSHNEIGYEGAMALADAWNANTALEFMSLSYNEIKKEVLDILDEIHKLKKARQNLTRE